MELADWQTNELHSFGLSQSHLTIQLGILNWKRYLPCDSTIKDESKQHCWCPRHMIHMNSLQKGKSNLYDQICKTRKRSSTELTLGFPCNSMTLAFTSTIPESRFPSMRAFWIRRSKMLTNNSNNLCIHGCSDNKANSNCNKHITF